LAKRFRNRKGFLSFNCFACCTFDFRFSSILVGWEGSAHDGRVLADAISKGFPTYPDQYYLADAGYSLSTQFLTPYRGVRYHLKEWGLAQNRPQTKEELFNLRHSSLRNVVERIFGVVKKRFPVLSLMPPYSIPMMRDIIICCFVLHNVVRKYQQYRDVFDDTAENESDEDNEMNHQAYEERVDIADSAAGKVLRDQIANDLWQDYQQCLRNRRQ
jgi:hypothetical protein